MNAKEKQYYDSYMHGKWSTLNFLKFHGSIPRGMALSWEHFIETLRRNGGECPVILSCIDTFYTVAYLFPVSSVMVVIEPYSMEVITLTEEEYKAAKDYHLNNVF